MEFMPFRLLTVILLALLMGGCSTPAGTYHTVREGQTLYRIGKTYGIDERYLARINGIDDPSRLRVGDQLYIPGADHERYVPSTVSPPPPTAIAPAPRGQTKSPDPSVNPPKSGAENAENDKSGEAASPPSDKGRFIWPVRGKVLSGFGTKGSAYRKGLQIAVPRGGTVVSAAAGRVIYSGNVIRGYGNLIILKHDNSFYTVYGFNSRNLVKAGSFVSKGEKIALAGAPPDGGSPRLYFEIRHGKTAVDPIFYLP
jgi:lipoprotein NlpD